MTDQPSPDRRADPAGELAPAGRLEPTGKPDRAEPSSPVGSESPMRTDEYRTAGGVRVRRRRVSVDPDQLAGRLAELTAELDHRRGGVLSSGVEYPGRYSRWHLGYVDPPIQLQGNGRHLRVAALNERGTVLVPAIAKAVAPVAESVTHTENGLELRVPDAGAVRTEEERTSQPSVFSVLRALTRFFGSPEDHDLGLYGAFGYDLAFQLEPVRRSRQATGTTTEPERGGHPTRDLVLHLPDRILLIDRKREVAFQLDYEFEYDGRATDGLPTETPAVGSSAPGERAGTNASPDTLPTSPEPGRFADIVRAALPYFRRGDLYEVTPSHVLYERCDSPADFFGRLRLENPAPYEAFFNLGDGEHLVVASPEMYVRVTGDRVETCPIAGTVARGSDALTDAEAIRTLLDSTKDEAELTMCTDVDRNDKARVCQPGSVRVIGRRQIELYSRLIHTVDHIEGRLRPGFDAFDAFLTHAWAVTVTGAPKQRAMQFIEDHEDSPRGWYGAATGVIGFDGNVNTGLTLRAATVTDGVAAIRVGATLLADSDPDTEEAETRLKARALLDVLRDRRTEASPAASGPEIREPAGANLRVLMVDHQDSFVLTLSDYFRQHGCVVDTVRYGFPEARLDELDPDLVVLSPGPGRPADFGCAELLDALDRRRLPAFGVCLGLQAMVEHRGGQLSLLPEPVHGKPSTVRAVRQRRPSVLLDGFDETFVAGRYHSIYADPSDVPGFEVTAVCDAPDPSTDGGPSRDGATETGRSAVTMAIEDDERQRWAVQFHPESIMSANDRAGHRLLGNLLRQVHRSRVP